MKITIGSQVISVKDFDTAKLLNEIYFYQSNIDLNSFEPELRELYNKLPDLIVYCINTENIKAKNKINEVKTIPYLSLQKMQVFFLEMEKESTLKTQEIAKSGLNLNPENLFELIFKIGVFMVKKRTWKIPLPNEIKLDYFEPIPILHIQSALSPVFYYYILKYYSAEALRMINDMIIIEKGIEFDDISKFPDQNLNLYRPNWENTEIMKQVILIRKYEMDMAQLLILWYGRFTNKKSYISRLKSFLKSAQDESQNSIILLDKELNILKSFVFHFEGHEEFLYNSSENFKDLPSKFDKIKELLEPIRGAFDEPGQIDRIINALVAYSDNNELHLPYQCKNILISNKVFYQQFLLVNEKIGISIKGISEVLQYFIYQNNGSRNGMKVSSIKQNLKRKEYRIKKNMEIVPDCTFI